MLKKLNSNMFKIEYGLSGIDYRVSNLYITPIGIIMQSLKSIGQS